MVWVANQLAFWSISHDFSSRPPVFLSGAMLIRHGLPVSSSPWSSRLLSPQIMLNSSVALFSCRRAWLKAGWTMRHQLLRLRNSALSRWGGHAYVHVMCSGLILLFFLFMLGLSCAYFFGPWGCLIQRCHYLYQYINIKKVLSESEL